MALIGSDSNSRKELNELWHRSMGHLHDRALRMLRETVTGVPALSTEHNDLCQGCVFGKIPHRALGKKTLEGVFTGKKPEVSHLGIFKSVAYCHILDEKSSKLDQTVEKGYLVGYSETSKEYRIYIPSNKKIVVRRDVKFVEDKAFRKSREMPAGEAAQHQVWVDAMVEEYSSIMTNDVWEVVPRPEDRSIVGSRWIYKIKYATNGNVAKYKARFMVKGYAQKEGINYEETFAPVARYDSIRSVISLAA
eukprot:PITA_08271